MSSQQLTINFDRLADITQLPLPLQELLAAARKATADAYAPYSNFYVATAARVGEHIVTTTNQENASFPVGLCAERTLLSVLTTQYAHAPVEAIALSYHNRRAHADSHAPISPCGLCRQSLLEFEQRMGRPIPILMSGMTGEIIMLHAIKDLLPFSFSSHQLK